MAASDARPVCRKGVAWRLYFSLRTSAGALYTSWAAQDSEVSLDGAAFADCTNEATEIGTSGIGYLDLTSSETNADAVCLKITTTGGLPYVVTIFPEEAGDYRADVTHFGGTAGTFSSGRPEVNATHWGGTAIASAVVNANVAQISGNSTAADNLEAAADGTGYNLGGGLVVAASVTGAVGSVGSGVTVATNNDKTGYSLSQSFPTNFASLAITGGGAVTAGTVSDKTGYSLTTAPLDAAGVRAAVGLASANLDTQLGTLATTAGIAALTGSQFTAIPWNSAWDAEVQSECTDAIVAAGLPRSGVTLRYTQVAANSGSKTADVSIGAAS